MGSYKCGNRYEVIYKHDSRIDGAYGVSIIYDHYRECEVAVEYYPYEQCNDLN